MKKLLLVTLSCIGLVSLTIVPAIADIPVLSSGTITSAAASGTSALIPLSGQSTCAVVVSDTSTATVTVQGTANGTTIAANNNFGSSGVVSVTSTAQTVVGSVAQYPNGFQISWASNLGTLTYAITCSSAVTGSDAVVNLLNSGISVTVPGGVSVNGTATVAGLGTAAAPTGGVVSTQVPDAFASGQSLNCAATTNSISAALNNDSDAVFQLTAFQAGCVVTFEYSADSGTLWSSMACYPISASTGLLGTATTTASAAGNFACPFNGFRNVRARVTTTAAGTVTVAYSATQAGGIPPPAAAATVSFATNPCFNNIPSHANLNMTTATTTQIVALSGSTVIYVCGLAISTNGASNVSLVYGTGANCVTAPATIAQYYFTANQGLTYGNGAGVVNKTIASQELCVTNSAAQTINVDVSYVQI